MIIFFNNQLKAVKTATIPQARAQATLDSNSIEDNPGCVLKNEKNFKFDRDYTYYIVTHTHMNIRFTDLWIIKEDNHKHSLFRFHNNLMDITTS